MKKYFLILAAVCTFAFAACTDKEDTASTNNVKTFDAKSVQPYTVKTAPIQEGQVTTITVDGQVICSTTTPMEYALPAGKTEQISYAPASKDNSTVNFSATGLLLCFEDVQSNGAVNVVTDSTPRLDEQGNVMHNQYGDTIYNYTHYGAAKYGDFNDLVCYVKIVNHTSSADIYIQPIALGSTLPIDFYIYDGQTAIASYNTVRTSLFNDKTGFINTTHRTYVYGDNQQYLNTNNTNYCKHIQLNNTVNLNNLTSCIFTHISASGSVAAHTVQHYAAMNTSAVSLSRLQGGNGWISDSYTGAPVGLAISVADAATCFQYPLEGVQAGGVPGNDINNCYNFYEWVMSKATFNNTPKDNTKVFSAVRLFVNTNIENLFSSTKAIVRR